MNACKRRHPSTVSWLTAFLHLAASPAPKTMTKEYQQQMTERAQEEKLNPISGTS